MLAERAVHLEEVAHIPVLQMLLKHKDQLAVIEGLEPVLPANLLQLPAAVAWEVEAEHSGMRIVLSAWNRRWRGVSLLGPVLDHVMIPRCQRLPGMIFLLAHLVDPFGMFGCIGEVVPILFDELSIFWRDVLGRNRGNVSFLAMTMLSFVV